MDIGEKMIGTAMVLWVIAFVTFILTAMVPVIPPAIGGPIFVGGLCAAPLLAASTMIYEIFFD